MYVRAVDETRCGRLEMTLAALDTHSSPDQRTDYGLPVRTWIIRRDDRWIALAEEFDVAGQGSSEGAALQNMAELLVDYLNICANEGMSLAAARRPIPLREQLRLRALRLIAVPLARMHARLKAAYRQTFNLDMHTGHVGTHVG